MAHGTSFTHHILSDLTNLGSNLILTETWKPNFERMDGFGDFDLTRLTNFGERLGGWIEPKCVTFSVCFLPSNLGSFYLRYTPKTNSSSLKMDGWNTMNTILSFWGPAYFQVRTVSFKEGTPLIVFPGFVASFTCFTLLYLMVCLFVCRYA